MKITTVGLDLAKSVFHVVCFDASHHEVSKRMLRRGQVKREKVTDLFSSQHSPDGVQPDGTIPCDSLPLAKEILR